MKEILISGSTAIDTLLYFDGKFEDQTDHGLNMSVMSEGFDKNNGWTGANIAYNLSLLWESPILLSAIGTDFEYEEVIATKTNLAYIHREQRWHTAHSIIVSDSNDNRMTFFHPGAMKYASESKMSYVKEEVWVAIISANHISTMIEHARECNEKGIHVILDPAQQISAMSSWDALELLSYGSSLIVNHKEFQDLQKITSKTESDIVSQLQEVIITYWAQWSHLHRNGEMYNFPAIQVEDFEDTTWAGDAYRAWLLKAIIDWHGWNLWCQLWTLLASYCILAPWSQHHHFSLGTVMEDMKHYYEIEIDLYNRRKY